MPTDQHQYSFGYHSQHSKSNKPPLEFHWNDPSSVCSVTCWATKTHVYDASCNRSRRHKVALLTWQYGKLAFPSCSSLPEWRRVHPFEVIIHRAGLESDPDDEPSLLLILRHRRRHRQRCWRRRLRRQRQNVFRENAVEGHQILITHICQKRAKGTNDVPP